MAAFDLALALQFVHGERQSLDAHELSQVERAQVRQRSGFSIRISIRRFGFQLIRRRFVSSQIAWGAMQERRALHFESFQVGSHGLFIPAEHGANPQRRFAAARF